MANRAVSLSFKIYGIIRESIFGRSRSALAQEQLQRRRGPSPPPPTTSPTKQRQQRFLTTGSGHISQRGDDAIRGPRSSNISETTNTGTSTSGATGKYEASTRQTTTTTTATATADMASDEDYMAFLNKANKDADEAHAYAAETVRAQAGARAQLKTLDAGEKAPQVIVDVCKQAVYTSDADEPFKEVSLRWTGEGGLPDEEEFAKLINHWDVGNAEISIMDPLDWDSNGQYTEVIEAVRKASRGSDVRVYRVVRDETRVEYWVVSRDGDRIVGAKALAIES